MGHADFRVGLAGGMYHSNGAKRGIPILKRADSDCAKGGLYKEPASGSSYDSLNPLSVTWNPDCFSSQSVDIHLYAPAINTSPLHAWQNVPNTGDGYNLTIMQRWYDNADSVQVQLRIVERGDSPFLSTLAAGPIFTLNYEAPESGAPTSADTTQEDAGITVVGAASTSSSSSKGKIAAGVLVPLLFAIVAIFFYVRWLRKKRAAKSKAFTEHVDKRMSTISTDWKSLSAKGASAAIRNSMVIGNRSSTFSYSGGRPESSLDADGSAPLPPPHMRQLRQKPLVSGERTSRVSFAETTRPSGETRRSTVGQSRAFHHSFAPPVPVPTRQGSGDGLDSGMMSPTQTVGALPLTPDAIRARISLHNGQDDVGPALSMMRTYHGESTSDISRSSMYVNGNNTHSVYGQTDSIYDGNMNSIYGLSNPYANSADDVVGSYITSPPAVAVRSETLFSSSPVSSPTIPGASSQFSNSPNGFSAMSPDEMLRAYAAQRSAGTAPSSPGAIRVMSPPMSPKPERRRTLIPAAPGVVSASRGAYGVDTDASMGRAE